MTIPYLPLVIGAIGMFIAASVGNVKFEDLIRDIWPHVLLFALVMFTVACYPPLGTFLPSLVK